MSAELFVADIKTDYQAFPPLVVDCSVVAALLFQEQDQESAYKLLSGKSLYAPDLIDSEICSVAIRKAAAGAEDIAMQGLQDFLELRMTRHVPNLSAQFRLAMQAELSAYDAAYLQVAMELGAPLATYDKRLARAAQRFLSG